MDVLACDTDTLSIAFVRKWQELTPAQRKIAGLEAIAFASQITPRRLWELYQGAVLMQSRETVGIKIARALHEVFDVTIRNAKTRKGLADREHLYKVSGSLPTPKGSTMNINVGQPQKQLEESDDTEGYLEPADDVLLRAAKVMNAKQLPPGPAQEEVIEGDPDEEEEE